MAQSTIEAVDMVQGFKETEKAVLLEVSVDFYNVEKTYSRKVWFPKSQIRNDKVTRWIMEQKQEDILSNVPFCPGGYMMSVYDANGELMY